MTVFIQIMAFSIIKTWSSGLWLCNSKINCFFVFFTYSDVELLWALDHHHAWVSEWWPIPKCCFWFIKWNKPNFLSSAFVSTVHRNFISMSRTSSICFFTPIIREGSFFFSFSFFCRRTLPWRSLLPSHFTKYYCGHCPGLWSGPFRCYLFCNLHDEFSMSSWSDFSFLTTPCEIN